MKHIEAMKLALEALENNTGEYRVDGAKNILHQAIAEAEQAQPVTWLKVIDTPGGWGKFVEARPHEKGSKPVYTAPPPRQPEQSCAETGVCVKSGRYCPPHQPLAEGEIEDLWSNQTFNITDLMHARDFVREIEAAHGIKENT